MPISIGLNTPDGAGCSLTRGPPGTGSRGVAVLMHLMVLGAP
mgnify:CR=1 FL=1